MIKASVSLKTLKITEVMSIKASFLAVETFGTLIPRHIKLKFSVNANCSTLFELWTSLKYSDFMHYYVLK